MNFTYETKCRIEKINAPLVKEKFTRVDVIVETIEERPQPLRFEFSKNEYVDQIAKLNRFKIGDEVIIKFRIKGNEAKNADGSRSGKYFNNLVAFDVTSADMNDFENSSGE